MHRFNEPPVDPPATPTIYHAITPHTTTPVKTSKWSKLQDKLTLYSSSRQASTSDRSHISLPKSDSHKLLDALGGDVYHPPPPSSSISHSRPSNFFQSPKRITKTLNTDGSSHSANSFASIRTTSIPRSTSRSFNSDSVSTPYSADLSTSRPDPTPPRVEPYLYSKTQTPPRTKKSLLNIKCCFCDELLSYKLSNEKFIGLSCGDTCHEECLWVLLNDNSNSKTATNPYAIFPSCDSCGKPAVPKDESIADGIVSRYLINSPPKKIISTSDSSDSLIISSNYEIPQIPNYRVKPPLYASSSGSSISNKFQSLSLSNKNSKDLSIHIPDRPFSRSHNRTSKSISRGSSISAASSIVSSVPKSPSPTLSSFNTMDDNRIPLALSRSKYVSHLVSNLQKNYKPTLQESEVDAFGLLRLVDKLLVSESGEKFKNLIVYLFQYNIVIINNDYSNMLPYGLLSTPNIKTPNSSTLKVSLKNNKSLYLSQTSNQILQKWIAGLCDYDFVFDSNSLSSTVKLNDIGDLDMKSIKSEATSFDSDNTSLKSEVSEQLLDNSDQMTLPVLLSPFKFDDATPTIETSNDSFFKKTDNLILILDFEKQLTLQSSIIIQNIVKVISQKFGGLKIILTSNSLSTVHSFGDDININDTSETLPDSVGEIVNQVAPEDSSILIISNCLKSESLKRLPIPNQLILLIQNPHFAKNGYDHTIKGSNVLKLAHWDNIMESLIQKLELSFGNEFDDDSDFDSEAVGTDFNSDVESDFDSDAVQTDFDSHDDYVPGIKENKEEGDGNNDDDILCLNSDSSISIQASPISDEAACKLTHQSSIHAENSTRWSVLFKDIDNALLEASKFSDVTQTN